jgi:hypothetical protein
MSKSKPKTYTALSAAEAEKAKAEQAVAAADHDFETGGRTAEQHQRTVAARDELAFHTRVHALAVDEHAAFERAEAERVAAEAEQQRLEQLAAVQKDIDANVASSILAAEALATGLRISWERAVASQGLGGSPINSWNYLVQEGLGRALVREGFPAGAIRIG